MATILAETTKRTRRRGNGEGSIYQRANGRWEAVISNGYSADGKRKRRTIYGKNQADVRDKLTRLQSSKLDGTLSEPTKMNVAKFLAHWLETAAKPRVRETTYINYRLVINKHISPRIGGIWLTKLTPIHVQGMYADMERSKRSVNTRHISHSILHRALKQAVRWGMLPRNVCDAVEGPRVPRVEIQPLNGEQVAILLRAAEGNRLEALYVLAIGTGMRLGEILGLQWPDVDLDVGAVQVRRALVDVNGKLKLVEPKTAKSRRRIELPDIAVAVLLQHRRSMIAEGLAASPWVFCNLRGGPLHRSNFHRGQFRPLLARAGLPRMRFHDLRHTSATLLLSAGVHPKIVQERLGHSQISMTMDTYSHVLQGMGREAAGKLDVIMSARPPAVAVAAG